MSPRHAPIAAKFPPDAPAVDFLDLGVPGVSRKERLEQRLNALEKDLAWFERYFAFVKGVRAAAHEGAVEGIRMGTEAEQTRAQIADVKAQLRRLSDGAVTEREAAQQAAREQSAGKAVLALVTDTPREAAELMEDLRKANPDNPYAEGCAVLLHRLEVRMLAHRYLCDAPNLLAGKPPDEARLTAFENMRAWLKEPGRAVMTTDAWEKVLDELAAEAPRLVG
jgi:hypothetical protein